MEQVYELSQDKKETKKRAPITPQAILSTYYVTSNGSSVVESNWSQWVQWSNWDQWSNWPHGR